MTVLLFLVWMFFFDTNDFITQYNMRQKLSDIDEEKKYYKSKIEEVKEDRKELLEQPALLEKFAREKYLMKKQGEQLFILKEVKQEEEE
jgi:cell division protein DivIC